VKVSPHEVRIIGGQYKRRKLPVLQMPGLRPTPDRVRETLFNWLGQSLDGWRCLDAFAGTGALGFEAASRGATQVVLLERNPQVAARLKIMRQQLQANAVQVHTCDALRWMAACTQTSFELVFLDPPFEAYTQTQTQTYTQQPEPSLKADLLGSALQLACQATVPGGFIYLEAPMAFTAPAALSVYRSGRAGQVHYHLFQKNRLTSAVQIANKPPEFQ
jgi:16S rRNA (guanine966-N2)-methyltransferase